MANPFQIAVEGFLQADSRRGTSLNHPDGRAIWARPGRRA
jgi:hypothetical protein